MPVPPGIVYLSKQLPKLLTPALAVYCAKLLAEPFFGVVIPPWLTATACVLSGPAVLTVIVQYRDYTIRREAAAHDAVVCPAIPGSIGGIHMLFAKTEDMYPGEPLAVHAPEFGHTLSVRFLFQNRILTSEPENIKAILATEFNSFEKGAEFRDLMEPLLGTGVFAADGDMWKFHRQMTRPFFHRERISDFDLFDRHAENAIGQLKARLREGYPADFQDMVSRFTLDAATSFLFNHDLHSLSAGLPYPHYVAAEISGAGAGKAHPSDIFSAAFQEAQSVTSLRSRLGVHWPLAEFWTDRLAKPMSVVRGFLDPILRDAVAKKQAAQARLGEDAKNSAEMGAEREVQEGETLLDHLVNYTEDHTILRDEILNISVAGRDTTASLLTFTIYMLAEHPEILNKLRSEILRVVGAMRAPTHDDFREMKFLRAVLNETLRLYSPVPFNTRTAQQSTVFRSSDGGPPIYVPAGTRTPFATIIMHRRKDLWGPDALEFDPDRFLDERLHKYLTPNPFIFLPFNAGPRICLGQQFAYHEASFFLVRLLQMFSAITLAPDAQPPASRPPAAWKTEDKVGWKATEKVRPRSHLTLFIVGGLWVRMEEASPGEL
ncbi:cytochrome P450 [Mycena epipterygia]|nr:cytochrome P450 [Mycena epipterygia]